MNSKLKWLGTGFLLVASGWLAAAIPLKEAQTVGVVQQWAPGARTIKVDGVTFQTAKDFQVLDRQGRKLPGQSVRAGTRVLVLSVDGQAMHVIVNPGQKSPFDQPQR